MSEESGTIRILTVVTVELGDRMVRCWCVDGFLVEDVRRRCRELSAAQAENRDMVVALLATKGVERVRVVDRFGMGVEGDISGGKKG